MLAIWMNQVHRKTYSDHWARGCTCYLVQTFDILWQLLFYWEDLLQSFWTVALWILVLKGFVLYLAWHCMFTVFLDLLLVLEVFVHDLFSKICWIFVTFLQLFPALTSELLNYRIKILFSKWIACDTKFTIWSQTQTVYAISLSMSTVGSLKTSTLCSLVNLNFHLLVRELSFNKFTYKRNFWMKRLCSLYNFEMFYVTIMNYKCKYSFVYAILYTTLN